MKDIKVRIVLSIYRRFICCKKLITTIWGILMCRVWGIKLGQHSSFLGVPILYRNPESMIVIGDRCRFNSSTNSNFRGLNHPCIIQTGKPGSRIIIGNHCGFSGTSIVADYEVIIEDNVICGANTQIGDRDDHSDRYFTHSSPILIKKGVWLGMNVVVLKGVSIGENTIIGANSVVTKSIPANVIAAGNPCKVIKYLDFF